MSRMYLILRSIQLFVRVIYQSQQCTDIDVFCLHDSLFARSNNPVNSFVEKTNFQTALFL